MGKKRSFTNSETRQIGSKEELKGHNGGSRVSLRSGSSTIRSFSSSRRESTVEPGKKIPLPVGAKNEKKTKKKISALKEKGRCEEAFLRRKKRLRRTKGRNPKLEEGGESSLVSALKN